MPTNYLHGVETIEISSGPVPVRVVKSAVIALVGIAPIGPAQSLVAVNNAVDAAQFGSPIPGFNIPQALAAIQKQGAGTCLVVNVWNESTMASAVTAETVTLVDRKAKTAFYPVGATAPVVKDATSTTTYVAGTDYSIDVYGNIVLIGTTIADNATLKVTYKKINSAGVTSSALIGGISNADVKTGMSLFDDAYNTYGYKGKIFICPGFSDIAAVKAALIALADKFKGICLIDQEAGSTPTEAIADRGPAGVEFNTSSRRAYLLYPMLKAYDAATNSYVDTPYSQWMAGVIAATDNNEGYWVSPSNHEIKGIVGTEIAISAAVNDSTTQANALNEAGITTVFNSFGTGLRTWGNRSASYPSSTHPRNFICVTRTEDVLNESVELAMLQFIDKPITQAVIDSIRETVNAFMRTLVSRGALIDGKNAQGQTTGCYFDKAKNTPTDIAAGRLTFDLVFCPPTPAEWITFNSFVDITLLSSLK